MKPADFKIVLDSTPRWVPMFRVTKVPAWATGYVGIGEEVFWDFRFNTIRTLEIPSDRVQRMNINLKASYIKFIGYREII